MKKRGTSLFKQLVSEGKKTVSLTPDASVQAAIFATGGVPPGDGFGRTHYIRRLWDTMTFIINQPAAGASVYNWDQLGQAINSLAWRSDDLGQIYEAKNTRGPVIQNILMPIALNYNVVHPRIQVPTADANYTCHLVTCLPLSYECLKLPDESAQAAVFFENGEFEHRINPTGVFGSGATMESVVVRASFEYFASPDKYLGVPIQLQDRQITGGGVGPILKGVGQQTGWQNMRQGAGIMAMFWLSNQLGLGGPSTVDNLRSIEIPGLGQPMTEDLDLFFHVLSLLHSRPAIRGALGTTVQTPLSGWPFTLAANPDGATRPASISGSIGLPIRVPGDDCETSKLPRWNGDLQVNFTTQTDITNPHRFVTIEALEFSESQIATLARRAGFGDVNNIARKVATPGGVDMGGALRYTAIEFM